MRIRVVVPGINRESEAMGLDQYSAAARPGTEISLAFLDDGPDSIESRYEATMAGPGIVSKVLAAEKDGVDAAIIDCVLDPGMDAAREIVSIPVVGPGETAMHIASMLGHRFSVITILDRLAPMFDRSAAIMGLGERLASVRAVNIPVLELVDTERAVRALVEQSAKAVREDGAHVIVFGCTSMIGLAGDVERGLEEQDITDVPVIDPATLAVKIAEALVDMGLVHSKRSYPVPPE